MTGIGRRAFSRLAAATLADAALAAWGRGAAAHSRGARVVVIGGEFGGATAAKSLRRLDGGLDVNGGAKLVHPGGAKLVHLTLCGTRCWGVVPAVHRRDPRCFV